MSQMVRFTLNGQKLLGNASKPFDLSGCRQI